MKEQSIAISRKASRHLPGQVRCRTVFPYVNTLSDVRSFYAGRLRRGIQLVELLVSLTSASVLMLGVVSSIYVTSRSRDLVSEKSGNTFLWNQGSERLLLDLSAATEIVSHADSDITFKVDVGEGSEKTVRYAWNGKGSPLLFSDTENQWLELSEPLSDFRITLADTEPQSVADLESFDPAGQFVFESLVYDTLDEPGKMRLPETFVAGDLLLAAVAVEDVSPGTIAELTGWTKIFETRNSKLSLAVFYTFTPSQPYVHFNWEWADDVLCAISHFRVTSASPTFTRRSTVTGKSTAPYVAETNTSKDNALIVRLLATTHNSVEDETTNLPEHLPLLLRSTSGGPSLGAAYRTQEKAGYVSGSNFHMESSEEYITTTLVFTP